MVPGSWEGARLPSFPNGRRAPCSRAFQNPEFQGPPASFPGPSCLECESDWVDSPALSGEGAASLALHYTLFPLLYSIFTSRPKEVGGGPPGPRDRAKRGSH
jgi:hypothetical protein